MITFKGSLEEKKLIDFPMNRQMFSYTCGSSVVQSILSYYGINKREDEIVKILDSNKKEGTHIEAIKKYLTKNNITFEEKTNCDSNDLIGFLDDGHPTVMLVQAWTDKKNVKWKNEWNSGHYVVAIGYDDNDFIFEDPSTHLRSSIKTTQLDDRWHDVDVNGTKYFGWCLVLKKKSNFNIDKVEKMK